MSPLESIYAYGNWPGLHTATFNVDCCAEMWWNPEQKSMTKSSIPILLLKTIVLIHGRNSKLKLILYLRKTGRPLIPKWIIYAIFRIFSNHMSGRLIHYILVALIHAQFRVNSSPSTLKIGVCNPGSVPYVNIDSTKIMSGYDIGKLSIIFSSEF